MLDDRLGESTRSSERFAFLNFGRRRPRSPRCRRSDTRPDQTKKVTSGLHGAMAPVINYVCDGAVAIINPDGDGGRFSIDAPQILDDSVSHGDQKDSVDRISGDSGHDLLAPDFHDTVGCKPGCPAQHKDFVDDDPVGFALRFFIEADSPHPTGVSGQVWNFDQDLVAGLNRSLPLRPLIGQGFEFPPQTRFRDVLLHDFSLSVVCGSGRRCRASNADPWLLRDGSRRCS